MVTGQKSLGADFTVSRVCAGTATLHFVLAGRSRYGSGLPFLVYPGSEQRCSVKGTFCWMD